MTRFSTTPGEKRRAVVCPNGRPLVVDLDSATVRPRPFPRVQHGTVLGLTPKEKIEVLQAADRLVLGQDATRAIVVRRGSPPQSAKPRSGKRGAGFGEKMFWWVVM